MAQKKTGHETPWTNEDVRELKAHSKARTPLTVMAKKMKRTERNPNLPARARRRLSRIIKAPALGRGLESEEETTKGRDTMDRTFRSLAKLRLWVIGRYVGMPSH